MVLDNATRGAVLVSFGSTLKAEDMSPQMTELFLEVFRRLELPVVWRWEGVLANPSANLLPMPWLPQQDLLAHPNLKVGVFAFFSPQLQPQGAGHPRRAGQSHRGNPAQSGGRWTSTDDRPAAKHAEGGEVGLR